jgi:hypothetical protein
MVQGIMENKMSACMGIPFSEMHCNGFFPLSDTLWVPTGYPSPFMGKPLFLKNYVDLYTQ